MNSIILAAGYATRLYPLTKTVPKPLLTVQGVSILDRLLRDLDTIPSITAHIIVANHRFFPQFTAWKAAHHYTKPITLLDDGSTENDNRLGAVKDIAFALEKTALADDILVLAGDNLLDFSLTQFVQFFEHKKTTCIMRHYEPSIARLQRTGVLVIDQQEKVLEMQEKPTEPKSHWACPPFYIYPKEDTRLIIDACNTNQCNTDAPGDFISWFCTQRTVHAYNMPGNRYDIGNLQSYEDAQKVVLP